MSRLLTLLLFYKAGYIVGKYVSMEMLIEKTKETYYEALQASSTGWHEGENSYEPFVKYYLGIMLKAYNEFESRVEHLKHRSLSKPDRIIFCLLCQAPMWSLYQRKKPDFMRAVAFRKRLIYIDKMEMDNLIKVTLTNYPTAPEEIASRTE